MWHKDAWHQVVYGNDMAAVGKALKIKADRLGVPHAGRWFLAAGEHPSARHQRVHSPHSRANSPHSRVYRRAA